jgi:hypothetical protein
MEFIWPTVDETVLNEKWRDRPRPGDTVVMDFQDYTGVVEQTFYCNGEGGMHVKFPHGVSWASCHRVIKVIREDGTVIEKASP